jgi:MFS family permease
VVGHILLNKKGIHKMLYNLSMTDQFPEEFVLEEGERFGIEENPGWVKRIIRAFPAFHERNFRLYFYGQLISVTGIWLQNVALGWLILALTHSALWVGTVSALSILPTLLFSLIGGVIVDRLDKKKILYFTQSSAMILAFILGMSTLLNVINIWGICTLSFLLGTVNAIDLPALQSFVSNMVNKERLASAIALNSALTNSARAIGPAVAGILISYVGIGWTFIFNALSFIAVLMAFAAMVIKSRIPRHEHTHPVTMIKEGLRYTFTHPGISMLTIMSAAIAIFGYSYTTMLPVIAENVFNKGAAGFGYLLSAAGLGAFVGAILVSAFSTRMSPRLAIIGGNMLLGIGLLSFSLSSNFTLALVFMVVIGFSFTFEFSMINTLIQYAVRSDMRGRVMSIFIMMFLGAASFGNFAIGYFSNVFGTQPVIEFDAIVVLIIGFIIWSMKSRIMELKRQR